MKNIKKYTSLMLCFSMLLMVGCKRNETSEGLSVENEPEPEIEVSIQEPEEDTTLEYQPPAGVEIYYGDDFKELRSNDREAYPDLSDAEFANFRMVNTTGIRENTLYRCSSPTAPGMGRNTYAMAEVEKAQVATIVNLYEYLESAQQEVGFPGSYYAHTIVYYAPVFDNFETVSYDHQMADGFKAIAKNGGPYLIHCVAGQDRTGFMCAILEALMGASLEEIEQDYIKSFTNYYPVIDGTHQALSEESIQSLCDEIVNYYFAYAFDTDDISSVDLSIGAEYYLLNKSGLTQEEVDQLKSRLAVEQ